MKKVKATARFGPTFSKWQRDTRVALLRIFSDDERTAKDFDDIHYHLPILTDSTPDSSYDRAYLEGLEQAEAFLESCIREIDDYWDGDTNSKNKIKPMADVELELKILQRYAQHHDAVGIHARKCARELDMREVISSIIGRPVEEVVAQRWHSRLAPSSPYPPGVLRPCSDSTINRSSHRFHARAYMEPGKAPAWDRIAELESRLHNQPLPYPQAVNPDAHNFVSEARITQLRSLPPASFDLRKLVRLCEEINIAYTGGALLATAMLTRAVLDHVPPIFGTKTFTQVACNYAGSRSFKETMERLDKAARKIADGYLHSHIRPKESLPEPQQVNFAAEIDALLAEIVRILS